MGSKRKTPEGSPNEVMWRTFTDALDDIERWVNDTTGIDAILDQQQRLAQVAEAVKILQGTLTAKLRQTVEAAEGQVVFMPDGRTASFKPGDPKRTLRANAKPLIRDRIARRCYAQCEGEALPALMAAIEFTETLYASETAMPKWGGLATLGFSSWADIADEDRKAGDVVIK